MEPDLNKLPSISSLKQQIIPRDRITVSVFIRLQMLTSADLMNPGKGGEHNAMLLNIYSHLFA